jgi:hypothetical protein
MGDQLSSDWLAREYETLRQESLASIGHRLQILSFGVAALGLLSGGASVASASKATPVSVGILSFAIPIVLVLVLFIWMGEFERMVRAGNYIVRIEARVNKGLGQPVLGWETWLRTKQAQMGYPYARSIDLFVMSAAPFPILGWFRSELSWIHISWLVVLPIAGLTLVRWRSSQFLKDLKVRSAQAGRPEEAE